MTKIKVILFSLLLLLLLSSSACAFEDTCERYPTGQFTDYWVYTHSLATTTLKVYPAGSTYHVLNFSSTGTTGTTYATINSTLPIYYNSISFVIKHLYATCSNSGASSYGAAGGTAKINFKLIDSTTGATAINYDIFSVIPSGWTPTTEVDKTFEILSTGGRVYLYKNGSFVADIGASPVHTCYVQISATTTGETNRWPWLFVDLDDISTGSCIGLSDLWTELSTTIDYSYKVNAFSSYPNSIYKASLYSLTGSSPGLLTSFTIPQQSGVTSFNRNSILGSNFGLCMLELTRDSDVLTDQYFYYGQSSSGESFPQVLFLGESSVKATIRDEDNNGGEVEGGGSVYLYPDINTPADYTFDYAISETPYAISTQLSTVYNTSSINSLKLDYSGLSMSYNVSIDGAETGQTGGSDIYTHTFTGAGLTNSHIIAFSPDYSAPGVWGVVADSTTQKGIKSATVSITGTNFGKTIYTDDNGLYYLTNGITPGEAYTISVTKTGYTTPPSQVATTQAGVTTRQDFFMDSIASENGEGLYYAPHSVTFTILENWYNYTGLPGLTYNVYNTSSGEVIKTGLTDSKGQFTVKEMNGGTNYTINLTYKGQNITEYVEPGLSEYTYVLNKQAVVHSYYNNWLSLTYSQNTTNATVTYASNKTLTGASLIATASNGTISYTQTLTSQNGSFVFPFSPGDYSLQFHIKASDNSEASQVWTITSPAIVNLFPTSYPSWLKNTLFTAIIILFLLAFGKSKNDIACGSVAVLTSFGYYFKWLTCSFNFVVLVWIIAAGAIYLHYKRTGATG